MTRWWEITIKKWKEQPDEELHGRAQVETVARIQAPTAQQAIRQLVDLTTNNGRVFRFDVVEIEDE